MSRRERRETDRINCRYNDTGAEVAVIEYTSFSYASSLSGPAWLPGMKELRLDDGDPVNVVEDGVYQHFATKRTMRAA